jgi:hypothetical protein
MLKLIRTQPIAKTYYSSGAQKMLYDLAITLAPVDMDARIGDCIECHFDPQNMRRFGNETFIIRQIDKTTWRIWRKK